ncbi:uncharacterized protein PV06_08432 [Exophiala oligosperma]|uniref:Protein kinase domain-containing protein n=2 Tax=Chaetothyriales TaxID=34395 RepID=A0A0D2DWG1_9EURO|nr:uncharacterized protein PV06_08432 [Exophiala oligosperma]KAJ9612810.1 hypothetical protein H2204_014885 [Knufia peltigerae]KIW39859.1 hypothetical protein PV06_08432 [Exophiala oligosperma]
MSVLGEVSAAIGLANSAIHRIHQGFILMSSVWRFGNDADQLRRKMEYEFLRFFMWEEQHEFSNLENAVGQEGHPGIAVKNSIIQELESLLPRGEKFEKRYNLIVEETNEDVETRVVNIGWPSLPSWLQRKFDTMVAETIHSRNGTLKKIRWAVFDKDSMTRLVQEIHVQISGLLEMTNLGIQSRILGTLTSMIRTGIKTSKDADDLECLSQLDFPQDARTDSQGEIAEASRLSKLKSSRIALGVDATSIEMEQQASFQNSVDIRRKRAEALKMLKKKSADYRTNTDWERVGPGLEIAIEKDGSKCWVLLERRRIENRANKIENGRRRHQIESLAFLLSELRSPSLHSLHCSGFYWEDGNIALIYSLPPPTDHESPSSPTALPNVVSLNTVLSDLSLKKADPTTRRQIACALTKVILQLHTAGWLHKQIRSSNILLTNFIESRWPSVQSFQGPFLVGYGYSRQIGPHDISDALLEDVDTRLYRHPMSVDLEQQQDSRDEYRPRFDLYSLGMVLLEVALWKPLKEIVPGIFGLVLHQKSFEPASVLLELQGNGPRDSVLAEVEYSEGLGFANVIRWCLDPREFIHSVETENQLEQDEFLDTTITLQEAVLTTLKDVKG